MSNTGTSVSGFAEAKSDMRMFDRLPPPVRTALNNANAEWSVDYFANWMILGPTTVLTMIERSDSEWTKAAYQEREFESDDVALLTRKRL